MCWNEGGRELKAHHASRSGKWDLCAIFRVTSHSPLDIALIRLSRCAWPMCSLRRESAGVLASAHQRRSRSRRNRSGALSTPCFVTGCRTHDLEAGCSESQPHQPKALVRARRITTAAPDEKRQPTAHHRLAGTDPPISPNRRL